jgi:hypothetical protein
MQPTYTIHLDKAKLEQMIRQHPGKAADLVQATALEGQRIVQMSLGTGPAGRSYTRGGATHVASAPGYPPNIDTGALLNDIHVEPRGALVRAVTTSMDYAPHLEYGTTNMAARPFMGPMARALAREVPGIFRGLLE